MKNHRFRMEIAVLIILGCGLVSCAAWGEFSLGRIDKMHEEDKKRITWFDNYIKSVLYVGMPEDEFVRLFMKDDSWIDPQKPYIIKHAGSAYIILCPDGVKHRISFVDTKLDKFETLGYEKIPVIGSTSWDYTSLLRGYRYPGGIIVGMSENEFLEKFANAVCAKLENGYVIRAKDGRKYGVAFRDKVLTDFWNTGNSSGKDRAPEFR